MGQGSYESWQRFDPLARERQSAGRTAGLLIVGLIATAAFYVLLGAALIIFAPMLNSEKDPAEKYEELNVTMVTEPPPEPPPEPIEEAVPEPEPKPEPEPEPEPEPKPEPKPEPNPPQPDPEPRPEPEVEPEPTDEPPPEEPVVDEEPASMDPVELEGLTMESTVEGGDFAVKQGTGIKSGKIGDRYVDPDRFDKIKTGKGDGDGSGSGTGKGTRKPAPPPGTCKDVKAKRLDGFYTVPPSKYPAAARRRGIEGRVVALLTVNTKGRVTDVQVVKSAGYGFDELAVDAFKRWKFKPAEKNCEKVETQIRYTYDFELDPY